ncbi:MAG TPA: hypothetical protein VK610_09220 [Rhodothermales bacterium]|nr:hypothetical protein [Rhodothermales bacterium]
MAFVRLDAASLLGLLRVGTLGPLHLGMTREAVTALLGSTPTSAI